jgi:hypothetical protein
MWLVDRSRIQAYHDCKRLRYLNYHYSGKGLERRHIGLPLVNGQALHSGFARLLVGEDIRDVIAELIKEYSAAAFDRGIYVESQADYQHLVAEQSALCEGLVRAWAQVRLPVLLAEFDVVKVEQEQPWKIYGDHESSIVDMVRCDALLRRKTDKLLFIYEFKSLTTLSEGWVQQWQHNSQLLANTLAIEELEGEPVGGVLIEGIIKGRRAVDRSSSSPFHGLITQQSPLCYGYSKPDPQTKENVYDLTWSARSTKVASWEVMPMERWIERMFTEADLKALFVQVDPIHPISRDLDSWKVQTIHQELKVLEDVAITGAVRETFGEEAFAHELDKRFPQNFNQCYRYFGHPCSFAAICYDAMVSRDPVASELYQPRTPHHPTEIPNEV